MKIKNERVKQRKTFSGLLFPIFALVVYIILIWSLSKPLMGWFALEQANEKGLSLAARYDGNNAAYHYMLGRYNHLNLSNPDFEKAVQDYSRSLMLSPLQAGVWIDLSKAYQIKGQNAEAEYALERAVKLNPNNPHLMWEAGTFWLINNMMDKAVSALRKYILLRPEKQREVYDLCWKLYLNNSYILANLVPESYAYQSRYLIYLIHTKKIKESREVWAMLDEDSLEEHVFIEYVNFLINNNLYEQAETVWEKITARIEGIDKNAASSLIWNSGFENKMLNGGFDWIIREAEGVDVFLDDTIRMIGNRSIGIIFDGKQNPGITIAQQVVRVNPGTKYRLRSYIKTDSLTTTNGIIIHVQGHNCNGIYRKSDSITGTNFWKSITVDFETPVECSAVIVEIKRERSTKFNNKIEGTAWIDEITLKQQAGLLKINSKKS